MPIKLSGLLGLGMDLDGTLNLLAVGQDLSLHALQQVAPNDGWSAWIPFPPRDEAHWAQANFAISQPQLAIENLIDTQALSAYFVGGRATVNFQRKLQAWGDDAGGYRLPSGTLDFFSTVTVMGLTAERPLDTLFAVQDTGRLYVTGGGVSSDWINLSSLPGAPAGIQDWNYPPCVAASLDGRLEVFGSGDGQLYHLWETAVGGPWSSWFSHGVPSGFTLLPSPILGTNQDGRLELFVVGTANPAAGIWPGSLFHIWQTAPSNGWSDWYSHGGPANVDVQTVPAIAPNTDGRLDLFVVGADGNLYEIRQVAPNDGWTDWLTVPAPAGRRSYLRRH